MSDEGICVCVLTSYAIVLSLYNLYLQWTVQKLRASVKACRERLNCLCSTRWED